jgi:hypothetical protein
MARFSVHVIRPTNTVEGIHMHHLADVQSLMTESHTFAIPDR